MIRWWAFNLDLLYFLKYTRRHICRGAKGGSSSCESEPQAQAAVQEGTSIFSLFIQLAIALPCNDHDALEKASSILKKLIK
jgi:hypothetical protein